MTHAEEINVQAYRPPLRERLKTLAAMTCLVVPVALLIWVFAAATAAL